MFGPALSRAGPGGPLGVLSAICRPACARRGASTRAAPGSQHALHEHEVEPAPELPADLLQMARLLETEALVHPDRAGVVGIDAGDHDVLAEGGAALQEHPHQRRADPL